MILITEFMDESAIEILRSKYEVDYAPELAERQQDIPAALADKKALIVRNRTKVTVSLLEAAPQLTCVGRLGVGLDNIDLKACARHNVTVYPATGANTLSVAEYVVSTVMVLMRGAFLSANRMKAGDWPRKECAGRETAGKCLGLIGYGAIARETARLAGALGMECVAYDPFLAKDDPLWGRTSRTGLNELLAQADAVSLHVPLTDETRYLINAERIANMKPSAILINAARGGVLDELALINALRSGQLGGAALDVFENEPMDAATGAVFCDVPNLILTPHIGGVTLESNIRVSALIAQKVQTHLEKLA